MNNSIARAQMSALQARADVAAWRKSDHTRRKCFVSYHIDDSDEVDEFVSKFGSEFIARCLGITEDDDFVKCDDDEYIKRRIREKYLSDSTVTILLLGRCTWARRFVDWEISSTLRNDSRNLRSGLLVMPLPSMNNSTRLPDRVKDNWSKDYPERSYAQYVTYPTSLADVRQKIESAYLGRTQKSSLVNNSRPLRKSNSPC